LSFFISGKLANFYCFLQENEKNIEKSLEGKKKVLPLQPVSEVTESSLTILKD